MSEFETRLAESLTARADRPVEVVGLAHRAVSRAGRIWIRRRVAGVAAAVVLLVGGAVGVHTLLPEKKDTTLPVALGVPSALSRPEGIGADPALLHLDLDVRAVGAATGREPVVTAWVSAEDREAVSVYGAGDTFIAAVYLAPSASDLKRSLRPLNPTATDTTVAGRPARVDTFGSGPDDTYTDLRWEPHDGIFAAVWARDAATAAKVFDAVRLDRVQRCVTPMRLSGLPAGAHWTECQTAILAGQIPGRRVWASSGLTVQQSDGERVLLWATEPGGDSPVFQQDRVVAGRPAQWLTEGQRGMWIPGFGPVNLLIAEGDNFHADLLSEEEAVWYADHLQIIEDLTNPAAWPTSATR